MRRSPATFAVPRYVPIRQTSGVITTERDPTCPDCRGRRLDRHGFDCVRCGGDGVVDE